MMQFSPTSRYFISFRSKYSPQHPVLKTPSLNVPALMSETRLHTHTGTKPELVCLAQRNTLRRVQSRAWTLTRGRRLRLPASGKKQEARNVKRHRGAHVANVIPWVPCARPKRCDIRRQSTSSVFSPTKRLQTITAHARSLYLHAVCYNIRVRYGGEYDRKYYLECDNV
jgi:hypothetical protein